MDEGWFDLGVPPWQAEPMSAARLTGPQIDTAVKRRNRERDWSKRTRPAAQVDAGYKKPFRRSDGGRKIGFRKD